MILLPYRRLGRVAAVAAALLLVSLPLGARAGSAVSPAGTGQFGLCDILPGLAPNGQSWNALAYAAGARINRWEIRWDRVEPSRGTFDYTADDAAVQQSLAAGLQVLGILIGTPAWAGHAGNGVPRGLTRGVGDPRNVWAQYVRATVTHYRGQVSDWEVWNEPDVPAFWRGTPDQYARLLVVAYRVIKAADPAAQVLVGGMVVPDLAFLGRVLSDTQQVAPRPFDAIAWHAYGPAPLLYTNLLHLRALLHADHLGPTPIWVTEDGFPASNPNGAPRQAAYVLQSIAFALAGGAARVLVYRASDDTSGKLWGLLDATGAPRPAYFAYGVAAGYLAGADHVVYAPDAHAARFTFYEPGRRVTVLWTHGVGDERFSLPAAAPGATMVDWQGAVSTLDGGEGIYRLSLPGAAYNAGIDPRGNVVGGPPILVSEPNVAPPGLTPRTVLTGGRTLAVLNAGSDAATVNVSLLGRSRVHDVVQVPGGSLRAVSLPLLGSGGYLVSESLPVAVQTTASAPLAAAWYAPSAGTLDLRNPGRQPAHVALTLYRAGHRSRRSLTLPALAHRVLSLPAAVVRSSQPIAVQGAVPQVRVSWYGIHPGRTAMSLFNPGHRTAAVDVRFVGAPTVTGQQLRLRPGRSFRVNPHGASAIVVQSAVPLAASPAVPGAATDASVAAAGSVTGVTLFNPSTEPAHVSYDVLASGGTRRQELVLRPSHLSSVAVRSAGGGPSGVIVHSDVPVVAVPTP